VLATIDPSNLRSDPRSNVLLIVTLSAGGRSHAVRIRNLSAHGALLEGASLPRSGLSAHLRRGSLDVSGTIAWSDAAHCGMRFDGAIDIKDWVKRVGSEQQSAMDAAIADMRFGRDTAYPRTPSSRCSANQFTEAGASLREICERIASLPYVPVELGKELIKIDVIAQSLLELR